MCVCISERKALLEPRFYCRFHTGFVPFHEIILKNATEYNTTSIKWLNTFLESDVGGQVIKIGSILTKYTCTLING